MTSDCAVAMEGVGDLKRALLAIRDALLHSAALVVFWSKRVFAMVQAIAGPPTSPGPDPDDDTVSCGSSGSSSRP